MAKHCHAILRIRFSRNYSLTIFLSWIKPTSRIRANYHSTILLIFRKSNLFSLGGHYKFHKMAESNCDTDYRKHLKVCYDSRQIIAMQMSRYSTLTIFLSWIKPTSRIWDNCHSNSILRMRKLNLFRLRWHN